MTDVVSSADEMIFKASNGMTFKFLHYQDCCENVGIEDVCGNLNDLIDSPLLIAEEVDNLDGFNSEAHSENYESSTWTFYKFATNKGSVTVRWLGTSNGYYSEGVSYEESR